MPERKTVVLLTSPKHPPRSGPPSAFYERGRGNILAERLLDVGHRVAMWWDHPEGPLLPCDPDVVLVRSSIHPLLKRADEFAAKGLTVVNEPEMQRASQDKLFQAHVFSTYGVAHPHSIDPFVTQWDGPSEVVVKPRSGRSGIGVRRGHANALEIKEGEMMQTFVEAVQDFRVTVVDGRDIGWARRTAKAGDFRTNLAQGATMVHAPPPSSQAQELVRLACASLGLRIAGVDVVLTDQGPIVLEVNAVTTLFGPDENSTREILDAVCTLVAQS